MCIADHDSSRITRSTAPVTILSLWNAGTPRVMVSGEIDLLTAPGLRATLCGWLAAAPTELILDLQSVTFFGAAGITMLQAVRATAVAVGTRLAVIASHCVRRALTLLGLTEEFQLVDTTEQALVAVRS